MTAVENNASYDEPYNTVNNLVVLKIAEFETNLDASTLLQSQRNLLSIQSQLINDFVETAAKQLHYFELSADAIDGTFIVLKCSINNVYAEFAQDCLSDEHTLVAELQQQTQKIENDLLNIKSEIATLISSAKIEDILKNLKTLQRNLKSGGKDLISSIIQIEQYFKDQDKFKDIQVALKKIKDKQDLTGLSKLLDQAIEFCLSLLGRDKVTKTEQAISKFTNKIEQKLNKKVSNLVI